MRQMHKPIQPQDILPDPHMRAFLGKRRFAAELSTFVFLSLLLFLFATVCLHGVALNVGTQLIAANRVNDLDEREQGVWARAHHRAYCLLVFGTSAALLYLGAASVTELPLPSLSGWGFLALIYWGVLVTLPSDILYWTEPDLEPDASTEDKVWEGRT